MDALDVVLSRAAFGFSNTDQLCRSHHCSSRANYGRKMPQIDGGWRPAPRQGVDGAALAITQARGGLPK